MVTFLWLNALKIKRSNLSLLHSPDLNVVVNGAGYVLLHAAFTTTFKSGECNKDKLDLFIFKAFNHKKVTMDVFITVEQKFE
jgi:hypothetical protein